MWITLNARELEGAVDGTGLVKSLEQFHDFLFVGVGSLRDIDILMVLQEFFGSTLVGENVVHHVVLDLEHVHEEENLDNGHWNHENDHLAIRI